MFMDISEDKKNRKKKILGAVMWGPNDPTLNANMSRVPQGLHQSTTLTSQRLRIGMDGISFHSRKCQLIENLSRRRN